MRVYRNRTPSTLTPSNIPKIPFNRLLAYVLIFFILVLGGFQRGQAHAIPDCTECIKIHLSGAISFLAHGDPRLLFVPYSSIYEKLSETTKTHDDSAIATELRYNSTPLNKSLASAWQVAQEPGDGRIFFTGADDLFISIFYALGILIFGVRIERLYLMFVLMLFVSVLFLEKFIQRNIQVIPPSIAKVGPLVLGSVAFTSLASSIVGNQAFTPINGRVIAISIFIPLYHLLVYSRYCTPTKRNLLLLIPQALMISMICLFRSSALPYLLGALLIHGISLIRHRMNRDAKYIGKSNKTSQLLVGSLVFIFLMHSVAGTFIPKNSPTTHPVGHVLLRGLNSYGSESVVKFLNFKNCEASEDACVANALNEKYSMDNYDLFSKIYESNSLELYFSAFRSYPLDVVFRVPMQMFNSTFRSTKQIFEMIKFNINNIDIFLICLVSLLYLLSIRRKEPAVTKIASHDFFVFSSFCLVFSLVPPVLVYSVNYGLSEVVGCVVMFILSVLYSIGRVSKSERGPSTQKSIKKSASRFLAVLFEGKN